MTTSRDSTQSTREVSTKRTLDREVDSLGRLVNATDTFIRTTTSADLKMLMVRARPSFIFHLDQARRLKYAIGSPGIGR